MDASFLLGQAGFLPRCAWCPAWLWHYCLGLALALQPALVLSLLPCLALATVVVVVVPCRLRCDGRPLSWGAAEAASCRRQQRAFDLLSYQLVAVLVAHRAVLVIGH